MREKLVRIALLAVESCRDAPHRNIRPGRHAEMPTFYARRDYPGLVSSFVQVADTNGDGIPDLIASLSGYIEVLFGNGDDTFRSGPNTHSGADGAVGFVAVDLNGDGTIDLALANQNSIAVSMGNGDGTFQSSVLYPVNDSGLAP